jgi:hypothetical protein
LDVSEVSPEVFDELDAAFLLLPELEVAVAARSHDEPGLRRDAMRHIIAVPGKERKSKNLLIEKMHTIKKTNNTQQTIISDDEI